MITSWLYFAVFFITISGYGAALAADSGSREYTVRGTVVSKCNMYDVDGNLRAPPQGYPPVFECDFIFYRKSSKWRLDIKHPDPAFDGGLWRTIMPLAGGGFTDMISFPPQPGTTDKGNAHVTVLTNQFLPAADVYGAHATWLMFHLDDILAKNACSNGCPPIWHFHPLEDDMRVNSHMIIRSGDAIAFWNTGRSAARDENGNVILEKGQPKVNVRPTPFNEGFVDAEYRPSSVFVSQELRIPKSAEFRTWAAVRDEKEPRGMRMLPIKEQRIENKVVESQSVPESAFDLTWTNPVAMVADFRRQGNITGQPLTYISRSNSFDPSERELNKRKLESDMQRAIAQPPRSIPKSLMMAALFIVTVTPLGIWWYYRRK